MEPIKANHPKGWDAKLQTLTVAARSCTRMRAEGWLSCRSRNNVVPGRLPESYDAGGNLRIASFYLVTVSLAPFSLSHK